MIERQTYLRDTGENNVKGITIIEVDTDAYRVTENREDGWCNPFWMPVDELKSHETEKVGKLSSDQFLSICRSSGISA